MLMLLASQDPGQVTEEKQLLHQGKVSGAKSHAAVTILETTKTCTAVSSPASHISPKSQQEMSEFPDQLLFPLSTCIFRR